MIRATKRILVSSIVMLMLSVFPAYAFPAATVAKTIGTKIAKGAASLLLSWASNKLDDSKLIISNAKIHNDVQVYDSLAIMSNLGISIKGNQVTIKDSEMRNDVELRKAFLAFSNAGISLSSKTVEITNGTKIINEVYVRNSALIGSNMGIEIGK